MLPVTDGTKRKQVVHRIVTELAPAFHVMDLQVFHRPALLTAPRISLQNTVSDNCVLFQVQFEPGSLLAQACCLRRS